MKFVKNAVKYSIPLLLLAGGLGRAHKPVHAHAQSFDKNYRVNYYNQNQFHHHNSNHLESVQIGHIYSQLYNHKVHRQSNHQNVNRLVPIQAEHSFRHQMHHQSSSHLEPIPAKHIYRHQIHHHYNVNRLKLINHHNHKSSQISNRIRPIYHHVHHHRFHTHLVINANHHHSKRIAKQARHSDWFRDGLNNHQLRARNWISWHESRNHWHILSYGKKCIGYFQLSPRYLGYRHGHIDLRPRHQVKVADTYTRYRYGTWTRAKRHWIIHHWY